MEGFNFPPFNEKKKDLNYIFPNSDSIVIFLGMYISVGNNITKK